MVLWTGCCALLIGSMIVGAEPVGTAFTYQGRLMDGGNPADGTYDLQFALYDDPNGLPANQVGPTLFGDDIGIQDGYFTVELDFGSNSFDGDARWLQVAVRPGGSSGDFTALRPLPPLTPSPYAVSSGEVTGRVRTAGIYETQPYNNWLPMESSRNWVSVAMSADGTIRTAVAALGQIYVSTDSGETWTPRESARNWRSAAMSADGTIQAAVGLNSQIYVSTDTGDTWVPRDSNRFWVSLAMSADGSVQIAATSNGQLYVSTDTGAAWAPKESSRLWSSVAVSADGTCQTAVVNSGQIYVSTDTGNTWTPKESPRKWVSAAMSADGILQTAVVYGGEIYVSADTGQSWKPRESSRNWTSAAMSSDGMIRTAVVDGGQVYISTNSGETWTPRASALGWRSAAMSADGTLLTAAVYGDQIYAADAWPEVGIGTTNPTQRLEVVGAVKADAFVGDGSELTNIAYTESDPSVGSNSLNYIPKWDGSALVTGTIYDNGNIGIGTASPLTNLHLDSQGNTELRIEHDDYKNTISFYASTNRRGYLEKDDDTGLFKISADGATDQLTIDESSGNVGITGILNRSSDLRMAADPGAEVAIGTGIVSDRKLNVYTDSDTYGLYSENAKSSGIKYGVRGTASGNSTGDSIGISGAGSSASGNNIGVHGLAVTASSGINYGIWGEAANSGAGDAYAAYFNGDVAAPGRTAIGKSAIAIDRDRRLDVYTHNDKYGLYSENTRTISDDNNYGMYGKTSGSNVINYGLYGEASGSSGHNYGVRGNATGNTTGSSYGVVGSSGSASGSNYGVRGYATTASVGSNIGIYGSASNSGTGSAWAGYFSGRGYFSGDVGIGTSSPSEKLDVEGNIDVSNNRVKNYRGYPRPDYDSGWVTIATDETRTLTHNLGGTVDNYVVDMQFKNTTGVAGINRVFAGGDHYYDLYLGANWRNLTSSSIQVVRNGDDVLVNQIRIRIWMYD